MGRAHEFVDGTAEVIVGKNRHGGRHGAHGL